jgi:peptide/nickel transport system permease protein
MGAAPLPWRGLRRTLSARHRGVTLAGFCVVGALAVLAALAPLVPGSPTEIARDLALRAPTWGQPFGMDDLGRSILSRVVHAYRVSLGVALGSVGLALLAGVPLGLVAGYAEGVLDQLIMRPLDVLMAFPAILLAIALMSVFGTGVLLVALSLAVVYTPIVARVVRAAVLAVKVEVYVDGARALGAPALRLVLRHVLPNAATPILVQASVLMAIAILVEASLSFLGVGVRPPTPSLGLMLADGRGFMVQAPWMVVFPGLAIMAAVLGFNMVADGLRDWLDPNQAAGPPARGAGRLPSAGETSPRRDARS